MKKLFYSFGILSIVLLALFTIGQVSTAQNKDETIPESENQKGFQKTGLAQAQASDGLWTRIDDLDLQQKRLERNIVPLAYETYRLNWQILTELLTKTPMEFSETAKTTEATIILPMPDGKPVRFRIEESPILSPEIAAQFPEWKTYQGYGIDDPTATVRFDVTTSGFHGQILSSAGTSLIDPYHENDRENYVVYFKRDVESKHSAFHCLLDEQLSRPESLAYAPDFSNGVRIRTYRLAVATTGEYTAYFEGQAEAFNQVVVTTNRVNGV